MNAYRLLWISVVVLSVIAMGCKEEEDGYKGTLTDFDGNTYKTVKIGEQVWMAENLKSVKYHDGIAIPDVMIYGDEAGNADVYGRLYNYDAATRGGVTDKNGFNQGACPTDFHIPTDFEWKTLEKFLGMTATDLNLMAWRGTVEGGMLKATGTQHWTAPNSEATNSSGFTALPGGSFNSGIGYTSKGLSAYFWTGTPINDYEKWSRVIQSNDGKIGRYPSGKDLGFSVRCVKN